MSLCDRLIACGITESAADYLTDLFLRGSGVTGLREFVEFYEMRCAK